MILGVDHLALSVSHTEQARKNLEARGFACDFIATGIPNPVVKKSLLANYQLTHDIGVFRPTKGGLAIEITNHGSVADNSTPYFYHDDYIELQTKEVIAERLFWKSVFRFKEDADGFLILRSPVPQWSCKIKCTENFNAISNSTLDGTGYACLAFLTNNIEQDSEIALISGALDLMNPFTLTVNGRGLEVVMFRTPGGAICELIQIRKCS